MKKLKICFFVPFYPKIKGGAEYQSKLIAIELKKMGHDIIFISEGFDQGSVSYEDGFKIYGVKVIPTHREKLTLYNCFVKRVCEVIERENPDIVYQRILNTFSLRVSIFTKKMNIPFVLHIADNYSVEFFNLRGIFKRKIFSIIMEHKPTLICQTEYQYSKIRRVDNFSEPVIIPNMHPVLTSEIRVKNKNEVIWVGNARPVKQLELFVELATRYKNSEYQFKIIGKLPQNSYGHKLLSIIRKNKNIVYLGQQNNDFVNEHLASAGLLVNTSSSEGFSNTFIQAWMSGTPVLALNSDPDNVMKKYGLGYNCKGDKNMFFLEMENILTSDNYNQICLNALEISNNLFSIKSNIVRLENVFKQITNV